MHCVPQMSSVDATLEALKEVRAERNADVPNLLLTHPRVPQVEPRYNDLNETPSTRPPSTAISCCSATTTRTNR